MVYCLNRNEKDPFFNLAAEEFMLKDFPHDAFMVWRNEASVIVGKHQNVSREVNQAFCAETGIPVIRRITGGGTVYHDPGNINFSFVSTGDEGKLVDFIKYTDPVIKFLKELGLNAYFEGKNNIRVNGLKVSGNAAHVYKNRVIHHGTLLYESNIDNLEKAISGNQSQYRDRSVRSIRSEVMNIKELAGQEMTIEEFSEKLFHFILERLSPSVVYSWSKEDIMRINEIKKVRYLDPVWTYNYSPDYTFENKFSFEGQNISLKIYVKKGIIEEVNFNDDGGLKDQLSEIQKNLTGTRHEYVSIANKLKSSIFASDKSQLLAKTVFRYLF